MKIVLINQDFRDVYTGKVRRAGTREKMTAERVTEIKAVSPDFVTVIGEVPEETDEKDTAEGKPKK